MKIIMWADVHAEHSVHGNNEKGKSQTSLTVDWLVAHASKEKPDAVFVLGDLFDEHGIIESSLAVTVRNKLLSLTKLGIKLVFVTGNHEYQEVTESFFGNGLLEAIFGGREDAGVYVIDSKARAIHLDNKTVLLGIPYRATKEQFTKTVMEPIGELSDSLKNKNVLVGWHCGVPNAAAWRGDEPENAFINESNPEMDVLFNLAFDQRIYCGHYHGPGDTAFGGKGVFTYVGSPSTRSISESGQAKRVAIWEDGKTTFTETHLDLDHITSSVEGALSHIRELTRLHGDSVLSMMKVKVRLPEGATMDDYNVSLSEVETAKAKALIQVERPEIRKTGLAHDIIEQAAKDPNYTQAMMERDVLIRSIFLTFATKGVKEPSLETVRSLTHLQEGEISDDVIKKHLFPDSKEDRRMLGTVGRMLVYAVKMAEGQAL
jgi:DNA repair exonuclease SbcCD nuclease subunit